MALILSDSHRNSTVKIGPYTRPKGPLEINWRHPFAKYLEAYFIVTPEGLRELRRGINYKLTGPASIEPNVVGNMALHYNGTGFDTVTLGFEITADTSTEEYRFAGGISLGSSVTQGAVCLLRNNPATTYAGFESLATPAVRLTNTVGGVVAESNSLTVTTDSYNLFLGSNYAQINNHQFSLSHVGQDNYNYVNNDDNVFSASNVAWDELWLNNTANNYSIDHFVVWRVRTPHSREVMPEYEMRQYLRNPMSLLRPRTRKLFIVPATATALDQKRVGAMHFQRVWEPTPMAYNE